jgi:hydroxymethylglutaryl-CoA reductase (NADPH)
MGCGDRENKMAQTSDRIRIPRDRENDYTNKSAATRREFIEQHTGAHLSHVAQYSLDPSTLPGNIENFTGVAQVPIGIAGPLLIRGEHAQGEFYIPMATTEGTLVSSYNRGMRLLTESGGVKTTVVDDAMQRAPVFMFDDALRAREFGLWVKENLDGIRQAAESTTQIGRLRSLRSGPCVIFVSTSPRGMPPGRTWPAKQPMPPANGSRTLIRFIPDTF